jgi:hypothetical protein
MKRTSSLLFVVLACAASFASSSADPRIIIKDPICGSNCITVGRFFSYYSPASGSGVQLFNNGSGLNWTKLLLTEFTVPASLISCIAPHTFAKCSVTTHNGKTTIFLTGVGESFSGISAGDNFSIGFKSWPQGGVFFTAAANVPEPPTALLVLIGLLGTKVYRRALRPENNN